MKKNNTFWKDVWEFVKDLLIAVVIAGVILTFIMPTIVKESSMENTLIENDYLFVSKKAYTLFGHPSRGDIVVFKSGLPMAGTNTTKLLVKRIVAIGGDTIAITDGKVYLNGQMISEPYLKDGYTNGELAETVVPEGTYFCMGDNRVVSRDSRDPSVGFVSEEALCGKVVFRLYPFSKFGVVK